MNGKCGTSKDFTIEVREKMTWRENIENLQKSVDFSEGMSYHLKKN